MNKKNRDYLNFKKKGYVLINNLLNKKELKFISNRLIYLGKKLLKEKLLYKGIYIECLFIIRR